MTRLLIRATIVCTLTAPVFAQSTTAPDADRRQVVPFLEGTNIFRNLPVSDIRFEGDINPNLIARQNFSDKLVINELRGTWQTAYSISGSPRVRLRMIEADSAPVRTPSYMPKGTFTVLRFRGESARRVGIWAGLLTVGHHSNGGDGCLFEGETKVTVDSKTTCIAAASAAPGLTTAPARINKIDGSFSTNFVRVGARYRRERLEQVSPDEQIGKRAVTVAVDVQQHFHTDPRVKPLYGTTRGDVALAFATRIKRVCRSRLSTGVTLSYVGGPPDGVGPLAIQLDGTCTFTNEGGWGLFARYYGGQDYYNLGFAESIKRFQFGVHYEQDGFLRFVTRRAMVEMKRQREARLAK
jgi:hypothetical protein